MSPLLLPAIWVSGQTQRQPSEAVAVITRVTAPEGQIGQLCGKNPNAIILKAELLGTGTVRFGWTTDGLVEGDETRTWNIVPTDYQGAYTFYFALIPDDGKQLTNSPNLTIVSAAPNLTTRAGIAAGWSESETRPNPFYGGTQCAAWDEHLPHVMSDERNVFGVERWSLRRPGAVRRSVFSVTVSG